MKKTVEYHYLLFSQLDFLQNHTLEEILRERSTYFLEQKKSRDFWLLMNPTFLQNPEAVEKLKKTIYFQNNGKNNGINSPYSKKNAVIPMNPCSGNFGVSLIPTIISTNKEFITWLSLRIGLFEEITLSPTLSVYIYDISNPSVSFSLSKNNDYQYSGLKGCLGIQNTDIMHPNKLQPLK